MVALDFVQPSQAHEFFMLVVAAAHLAVQQYLVLAAAAAAEMAAHPVVLELPIQAVAVVDNPSKLLVPLAQVVQASSLCVTHKSTQPQLW
jgi:hypothetical protein